MITDYPIKKAAADCHLQRPRIKSKVVFDKISIYFRGRLVKSITMMLHLKSYQLRLAILSKAIALGG